MRGDQLKDCGGCGIYLIRNTVNGHIYVGQTKNQFITRWKDHIRRAKHLNIKTNLNLVVMAMRKYGIDKFDFSVLEQCEADELDEREKFWINKLGANTHDNYNQTAGGQMSNMSASQSDWVKAVLSDLLFTDLSVKDIAMKYDKTDDQIYKINAGQNFYNTDIVYPIRNLVGATKLHLYDDIRDQIKNSVLTFKEIASLYNCSISLVKRLNAGLGSYYKANETYPLRTQKILTDEQVYQIRKMLSETTLLYKDIAKQFNVSPSAISKINCGVLKFDETIDYPIRQ